MKWIKWAVLASAGMVLVVPAVVGVYRSVVVHDWHMSSRFDGIRYVVSEERQAGLSVDEQTRAVVLLNTLDAWRRGSQDARPRDLALSAEPFDNRLATFKRLAEEVGLRGHWLDASTAALGQLKTPFVAHVAHDGGSLLIVREVRGEYVYATDPLVGTLLYRLRDFGNVWTGRALVFPDPPPAPQEWR